MPEPRAIILVGERPTTARWPLRDAPPGLAPLANRPVLVHQLDALMDAGIAWIVVAGDDEVRDSASELIAGARRPGVRIDYMALDSSLEPGHALMLGARLAERAPLVVVEPAAAFTYDVRPALAHVADDPLAAVVYPLTSRGGAPGAVPLRSRGAVGGAVLGPDAVEAVTTLASAPDLAAAGLVKLLHAFGARVSTSDAPGWCVRIDDVDDLLVANELLLDELAAAATNRGPRLRGVDPRAIVHPSAELDCAVVRAPAVIGARAQLRDCYVGPHTSIGDDAVVEGVEVER
jgi:glucose-1-phosphate thymidylyltransferase